MPEPRIELHSLLLCDYAMTAQDGKISAIGVFSQINVARLPVVHGRCFIVAVLEADPGQHQVALQVVAPNGQQVLQRPPQIQLQVPPNAMTANLVADLKGMRIEQLGRYRIELRSGDRLLGSTPFNVNLLWRSQQAASA